MIKGHVKIELLDHKTGKLRTTERENMLTNALAYRAGIDSNDTIALYSNENSIMPLATKGLGGLLLFDGPLTEDAGNIHFPMDVHLTGCAGRGSGNPASALQGTIDNTASGYANGKYTTVSRATRNGNTPESTPTASSQARGRRNGRSCRD